MKKIYLGKYVNTHGIKGEIRIKSLFKYKDKAFKIGNIIYINNKKFIINSYRVHKDFDMITLKGINNINDIIELKGNDVYIDYDSINLSNNEYLDEDLLNCHVYMNNIEKGIVTDYKYFNKNKKVLVINNNKMVPCELIENIDLDNKKIEILKVDGLL